MRVHAALGTKVAEFNRTVQQMVCDGGRKRIYGTTTANTVLVVNTETLTTDAEIPIGSNPIGLDISPDGSKLYVANSGSTTAGIAIVDLETLTTLPSLPTTNATRQVVAGLNGHLYVVQDQLRQLDATTGAVQATFSGYGATGSVSVYGGVLAITPDRKTLFYGDTGLSPSTLYAFDVSGDTATYREKTPFDTVGENGEDLIMSPDGSALCYTNGGGNGSGYDIALIPTNSINARMGTFNCGAYPLNGAFSPDGGLFFTAPATQQQVQIYDTKTFTKINSFAINTYEPGRLLCDGSGTYLFQAAHNNYYSTDDTLRVYKIGTSGLPAITSASSVTFHEGETASFTLTSDSLGVTWSATGLPAGLSLDPVSGAISGKVSVPKQYSVQVTATTTVGEKTTATLAMDVQTQVHLSVTGSGYVVGASVGATWMSVGASLDLQAYPDPDGGFIAWGGDVSSTNSLLHATVTADMNVLASFIQLVPITFSVYGNGWISGAVSGQRAGTTLTVRAVPYGNAHFIGWTGAITSSNPTLTFTVGTSPMALRANFASGALVNLSVTSVGPGSVAAAYAGDTQQVAGTPVTIQATPQVGARFIGWSGTVQSSNPQLTLTLLGNTVLVANFEALVSFRGSYRLVSDSATAMSNRSSMAVTVDAYGNFTANLTYGRDHYVFRGSFASVAGADFVLAGRNHGLPIAVHLDLTNAQGARTITGTVTSGGVSQTLAGYHTSIYTRVAANPWQGSYTLLLPPDQAGLGLAWGYATARVGAMGAVSIAGVLGDHTAFSAGGVVDEGDSVNLNLMLPDRRGFLEGALHFAHSGTSDIAGSLNWVRPAVGQSPALSFAQPVSGSLVPATPGTNLLSFSTGTVTVQQGGAGLIADLTNPVQIGAHDSIIPLAPNTLSLRFTSAPMNRSLFTGSLIPPDTRRGARASFRGVIDAGSQMAVGQYLGTSGPGSILLQQ